MSASTRRAALGAILAAPLASVPAIAAPSALARSCDWGVAHLAWINDPASDDRHWPDERLEGELDRVDEMMARVAGMVSANRADLAAKARFIMADIGEHFDGSDFAVDRAMLSLLREVIALCA